MPFTTPRPPAFSISRFEQKDALQIWPLSYLLVANPSGMPATPEGKAFSWGNHKGLIVQAD
jgi:hypothetical protein